jgi:hypothetical protein
LHREGLEGFEFTLDQRTDALAAFRRWIWKEKRGGFLLDVGPLTLPRTATDDFAEIVKLRVGKSIRNRMKTGATKPYSLSTSIPLPDPMKNRSAKGKTIGDFSCG